MKSIAFYIHIIWSSPSWCAGTSPVFYNWSSSYTVVYFSFFCILYRSCENNIFLFKNKAINEIFWVHWAWGYFLCIVFNKIDLWRNSGVRKVRFGIDNIIRISISPQHRGFHPGISCTVYTVFGGKRPTAPIVPNSSNPSFTRLQLRPKNKFIVPMLWLYFNVHTVYPPILPLSVPANKLWCLGNGGIWSHV